ncbi:SDR family oxidoreductase [Mucilaginibacter jinjuensis]|uniref:SDR family NAD(P)-dependent oxidoreductase n=1 Tax=Mucilaginibacter jinjuensis TaxID=1176721 RepID=A0ABY7TF00_9SPHI|nr:SDR family NAD(P)-dependent oxidoreductase [Mucilaginibacter jinjuensis]WCT14773.1 SDR family NAD(P)-dependent oxidoreductase [Mucilaginibacter jinjuensis]
MNISNKTVLIIGGSAGIGFETAKLLTSKGNKVIITGRDENRLKAAAAKIEGVSYFVGDVSSEADTLKLVDYINQNFPQLDVLINNAGRAVVYQLTDNANAFDIASDEILTNYLAIIRLTEKLLPVLRAQKEAVIVNVTSIVVFAPGASLPTYAASKAALHSYTRSLRYALKDTGVKVFELMPPLVDTDFSTEIGGHNGIPPSQVAEELLDGLTNDVAEIHVGQTADMYKLYLSSPEQALLVLNSRGE